MASEPFAPSRIGLGWQVLERGASGFTGWTEGLRRTQDAAALKRMYKAKRPDDVATLQVELAVEGALEVDVVGGLDDDEEGARAPRSAQSGAPLKPKATSLTSSSTGVPIGAPPAPSWARDSAARRSSRAPRITRSVLAAISRCTSACWSVHTRCSVWPCACTAMRTRAASSPPTARRCRRRRHPRLPQRLHFPQLLQSRRVARRRRAPRTLTCAAGATATAMLSARATSSCVTAPSAGGPCARAVSVLTWARTRWMRCALRAAEDG